jgi:hypothetical protein
MILLHQIEVKSIDTENYVNNAIFICSECDIIWSSNNGTFYNEKMCPICDKLCRSKYIWYSNTNLSNDIINKCSIKLIPRNQNDGIWIKSIEYKSFGIFECKCILNKNKKFKKWGSAYANSKYKQKCTKCNIEYFPKFMWVNHTDNKRNKKQDDKKHLYALYGGCKDNNCKYINKKIY